VKLHASELGIDSSTVILGGASAGGFLATEAALNPSINAPGDNLSVGANACALVLLNPAFTPTHRYGPDVLLFVNKHTPPSIVFYGDNDKFKPGGLKYLEKLDAFNIKTDYWIANNETHSYYSKPQWETLSSQLAYNFLIEAKVIKGKAIPISNNIYADKPASKKP
jgi:acetyl esterase/lipase